jgi:uncharacterized protein (DUF2141 family)
MRIKIYKVFILPLLLIILTSYHPQDAGLKVTITNLRNNKGHVLISVFKNGVGYPDRPEKSFKRVKLSINNKTIVFDFTGLPTGNYAIAILHDENDDMKLNTNILGIPKEGFGFSNNVIGVFGPPGYSKASFNYNANVAATITIKARY